MTYRDQKEVAAYAATAIIAIGSLVLLAACAWRKRLRLRHTLLFLGYYIVFGVAVWFLINYNPWGGDSPCGADSGTVPINGQLEDYGFGPNKRLIVVNLTEIGGVSGIHDDDKKPAHMQTWVDGELKQHYNIGVEIKGTLDDLSYKVGLSIETQDDEWDGKDTQFTEFEFNREYEDYVLRRELSSKGFIRDGAVFKLQSQYYDYVMVEVVYVVGNQYTYEGIFYFVNNPVKKDTINGATKLKHPDNQCEETTYIIEYEHEANKPGNLTGFPNLELKYPKPSKLENVPECKLYLENLLAFNNVSQLDWTSLADGFVLYQSVLPLDMQYRSMVSHVFENQLRSGPVWDPDGEMIEIGSDDMSKWIVWDDRWHRNWWKTWFQRYTSEFETAIRQSTMAEAYNTAYMVTHNTLSEQINNNYFSREEERWPCVKMSQEIANDLRWHTKRSNWVTSHVANFKASDVTYIELPWIFVQKLLISGVAVFAAGVLVQIWHLACSRKRVKVSNQWAPIRRM